MALTYIEDLPNDQAQPIELRHQSPFVAIIQVDGPARTKQFITFSFETTNSMASLLVFRR